MSAITKFKFVSPGIFVNEIDNSQVPGAPTAMGPIIIGRTERGPALVPTRVSSFEEFVNVFGAPIAIEPAQDVWRDGNRQGPTYASYAAQAWLAAGQAPVTVVRLLGDNHLDASSDGKAGWQTSQATYDQSEASNGGAYGLWLVDSGAIQSGPLIGYPLTGALAAVWYVEDGAMVLSGTLLADAGGDGTATASAGGLVGSSGADKEFRAIVYQTDGTTKTIETAFNFNRDSDKYIRKVFNTNPQMVNSTISSTTVNYWLGQTYERFVSDTLSSGTAAGTVWGVLLPMKSGSVYGSSYRGSYKLSKTGWVFSQQVETDYATFLPENQQKLFRFVARDAGEELPKKFKIGITNIRPSQQPYDVDSYATFDVVIRAAGDNDNAQRILEKFSGLTLNPFSPDYIARQVGDRYQEWDSDKKRWRYYGSFENISKYVRIEMNTDVEEGKTDATYMPFGNYGPTRWKGWSYCSGSQYIGAYGASLAAAAVSPLTFVIPASGNVPMPAFASGLTGSEGNVLLASGSALPALNVGSGSFTGSFRFPKLALRVSSSDGGLSDERNAYFGPQITRTQTSTRFDEDYGDYIYPIAGSPGGDTDNFALASAVEYTYVFTLDDIIVTGSTNNPTSKASYSSGSRRAGTSYTANYSASALLETAGFDSFIVPLYGGYNGLDIKEVEPFRNSKLDDDSEVETDNYAFYTIKSAVDRVSDADEIECNLMAMPNVQNETLTKHLIDTCESRGDALAIIDVKGDYLLSSEDTQTAAQRRPNVDNVTNNMRLRGINSSYGCAFFPYVMIRDTINGAILDCPPSVVALGTFASSQAVSALWFAPAGFNRGGLSQGAAGLPVISTKLRLNSKDRDKLYASNVNPIATFPSEGIVVFGQKTLQVTPSALDRINVRRLLIFIKKEISRIAATILFDQNVDVTWARFRNASETFLSSVKAGLGLSEYKVVLDSTTTTPDLIDRNALYAKIFLKPARAIEFIAIDFVITRTGAAFED